MYCNKCSCKIEKDSKFCKYCGKKIEKSPNYLTVFFIILCIAVAEFSGALLIGKKISLLIKDNFNKNKQTISDSYYNNNYNEDNNRYGNSFYDFFNNYGYDNEDGNEINPSDESFNNIDVDKFIELKKDTKPSIIYIGRNSNTLCFQQTLYLYSIIKQYKLLINYLDITNISNSDYQKLQSSDSYFANNWPIPLILIVQDDKIIDKKEGFQNTENLINWFNENQLLNSENQEE